MANRFDYIKYDDMSLLQQGLFKEKITALEEDITKVFTGRSGSIALTKLEECYMWIGKAIRDEQIARSEVK